VLIWGPYVHPRARKEPGSVFLSRFFIDLGYWLFAKLEGAALALRLTPNQLTAGSLACSVGGAIAFAVGNPGLGGGLVLGCAVLDALDGMVARTRGTASDAGELIDAAVDRYAEIATFAGIAAYYRNYPLGFWLALLSLGGALLVSYARAKGEISGIDARMGSMNRGERAFYVGMAGLFAADVSRYFEPGAAHPVFYLLLGALVLVAVMANVTAIRRFAFIYKELRARDPRPQASADDEMRYTGWFGRAGIASAIATAVDYGTFTVLVGLLGTFTGTATAAGALLGAITNFTINKVWTFRSRKTPVWVEAPRYAAISLTSLLLNTAGVVMLAEGLKWSPIGARLLVGLLVSFGWNLPLHRYFVFRGETGQRRPGLSLLGALASALGSIAVLVVAYGAPFAEESVSGFSIAAKDTATVTQTSFLPKLLNEAFYSESYSFLLAGEDGSFARVQFLVSNAGLAGHGKAAVRAVVVSPDGTTTEDADTFEPGQWSIRPEGAIEMGAHRLTMGPDASHHVHFGGKQLVIDAMVLPETQAVRPGGGRIVFDTGGHAVFDQTIFALRSRFEGSIWSQDRGARRARGYCYADTSYSTVPAYKSASLWYRMEAFDDVATPGAAGTGQPPGEVFTAALAVLFPPGGSRLPPQGWLYASQGGKTALRSTSVQLKFEHPKHESGGHFEYDVPQEVKATATGSAGEIITVELTARRLLYKEDVVSELGPFSRFLVSTVASPMAYTYENRYHLRVERPGKPPQDHTGIALSEFSFANRPSDLRLF
jgi:CDP-diacylglycerol--glycerol-3-phosphate 3-phosphatidyltransferase